MEFVVGGTINDKQQILISLYTSQSHMEQSLADRHYSVGPKCQQIPISIVLCSNFLKPVIFEDLHKSESCSIS